MWAYEYFMIVCRILTEDVNRRYLTLLVNAMSRCTLFLVAEPSFFNPNLVHGFCVATLEECAKAQMIERLLAVCVIAQSITFCYSLDRFYTGKLIIVFLIAGWSQSLFVSGFELDREHKNFA